MSPRRLLTEWGTPLATALKAPWITEAAARLADQVRDAGWTHEDYLAAVLERAVSARNRCKRDGRASPKGGELVFHV